jgi:hypothetical protein
VPFSLAQPLVHGLKNDVVCRDSRIKDLIPLREIGFEDSVKLALTEYQKPLRSRWTDADIIKHPNFTEEEPLLVDQREQECLAPASAVYDCVSRIGGDNGYYHAHWLWQLRAGIDWLLGGVGMRRGRPRAKQLFAGDPVDFWRVEEVKPPNTLVLYAEMKLPGQARLRFDVDSLSETRSRLKLSALFLPNGLFGKVYWYSLLPLHAYIFGGMLNRIASEAQTLANQARLQSRSE